MNLEAVIGYAPWSGPVAGFFLLMMMLAGGQFIMFLLNEYFIGRGAPSGKAHMYSLLVTLGFYLMLTPLAQPIFLMCGMVHISTITTTLFGHRTTLPDWVKQAYKLDANGNPPDRKQ